MGTTLTGTTPQDTYDSLIKVTDNGPISGTLKALSDGLGNDSTLSLSTTAASIAGTLAVTGNATFDTSTLFVDATNNRVGIGTVLPAGNLHIASATDGVIRIQGSASGLSYIDLADTASGTPAGSIAYNHISNAIIFSTDTNVERARITSNGLSFNGDTAAANALDDYEEGTWTMGVSFGGASVGVTYDRNTGSYTKIGRQVTVNGYIILTSKGSSTGSARITGLPFTIQNANANYSPSSLLFGSITFANQFQGFGVINSTTIALEETTILGVSTDITNADFANNSQIMVSLTYFV